MRERRSLYPFCPELNVLLYWQLCLRKRGMLRLLTLGATFLAKLISLLYLLNWELPTNAVCGGIEQPRVGLLNIGVESKKGTSEMRQAYLLLQAMAQREEMLFIGNVEGRDVFQGAVDVLVTDGFTGNVLLKTSEGVSSFILQQLQEHLREILPEQRSSILSYLQYQFDYEEYNGAIICGVNSSLSSVMVILRLKGFCEEFKERSGLFKINFFTKSSKN